VAGSRGSEASRSFYLAKYDAAGTLLWSTDARPESALPGEARAMVIDRTGDVFVAGGESTDGTQSSIVAARYSGADGRLLWRAPVSPPTAGGGTLEGAGEVLALGTAGQVVLGGYVRNEGQLSAVICRLDPANGAPLWYWAAADVLVRELALDRRGDVLATGTSLVGVKLAGDTGAQLWRVAAPSESLREVGYPQLRALTVDSRGDVTVGGSLRNTLDDTRAFYVARLDSAAGRFLWESAGPPQYAFETPARLVTVGSDTVAAGRYQGTPAALRLRAREGSVRWSLQPWQTDDQPDSTAGVADLAADGSKLFVLGTDYPGQLLLTGFSGTGRSLWKQNLGPGQGLRLAPAPRSRLYLLGRTPAADGLSGSSVLLGLDCRTGQHLKGPTVP
jgi:hypothetical protein